MRKYDFAKMEKRWAAAWEKEDAYAAKDSGKKPKAYVLIEFPYPSGEGLHMGHLRPYVAGDVYARLLRMSGREVMFPMGWDAFGLPAENFAIKKGVHPSITTARNVKNARAQVKGWGISFDWAREVNTTDPAYYKWTQWIFLELYKAGLAYESEGLINWCPKDKTGLANEEVLGGRCERCGTAVEQKVVRQWYLRITAYAEKLLAGLKDLDWPEQIKLQQENWIGRKEGAEIRFRIENLESRIENAAITVFTTRPDTLFGATYVVLAPEHELVTRLRPKITNWKEVEQYVHASQNRPEEERTSDNKEKTGVELKGVKAINPATGEKMPVWVADYVLGHYGTGAIMAVPAHDQRDHAFATKFKLSIKAVIFPREQMLSVNDVKETRKDKSGVLLWERNVLDKPFIGEGFLINSGKFDGHSTEEARNTVTKEFGKPRVQYHLRDWVFSRQRYWGEPIPLVHCAKCGVQPVPEKDLPVKLPPVKKYEPTGTGESPLAAVESWVRTKCPKCKGPARRETNTMPQWAGSSWYYLRYADPKNKKRFASSKLLKRWLPVDIYFGGMEHTTLHLLYSRFWHLFLYDRKLVPTREPYARRIPHGIILGSDGEKMSKSRGNGVNPDEIVKRFGADTLRMYEMFLGPHGATVIWSDGGILGVSRFLDRVWKKFQEPPSRTRSGEPVMKALHRAIKKVEEDIREFRFNTAISTLMIFLNGTEAEPWDTRVRRDVVKVLAPFAPFLAEELWRGLLDEKRSVHLAAWPHYDPDLIREETFTLVVQVNGKVRASLTVAKDISEAEAKDLALAEPHVKEFVGGKPPQRIIYVPGRLVNIVV